jgi:hypothetical protein
MAGEGTNRSQAALTSFFATNALLSSWTAVSGTAAAGTASCLKGIANIGRPKSPVTAPVIVSQADFFAHEAGAFSEFGAMHLHRRKPSSPASLPS